VNVDSLEEDGSLGLALLDADSPLDLSPLAEAVWVPFWAAFEKNPRMELWFLVDAALEFDFFSEEVCRAGVDSSVLTIAAERIQDKNFPGKAQHIEKKFLL
jgi:hypothetical protein